MGVVWTIVGAVAGLLLGAMFEYESAYALGFVGGGAIGFLLSRVIALNARIRGIEEDLVVMQQTIATHTPGPGGPPGAGHRFARRGERRSRRAQRSG